MKYSESTDLNPTLCLYWPLTHGTKQHILFIYDLYRDDSNIIWPTFLNLSVSSWDKVSHDVENDNQGERLSVIWTIRTLENIPRHSCRWWGEKISKDYEIPVHKECFLPKVLICCYSHRFWKRICKPTNERKSRLLWYACDWGMYQHVVCDLL